ncbi:MULTISPECIES: hypothetical protein [Yersinia pseudotuberculosis complex]|uniref:Uncharacterized protein n=1 Tax=Yersinia similis TaxID=367190 RepID=A0A0T9PSP7_9GAMM|nr:MULTISPECIES: hypothetical protein [Yersinia pseudotuberculosis complex]CNC25215.1 Uncharacterised protein [Yersinia similis]CND24500.1 Uncharacterised protein [Yersinia pseudotuberculosis]CNF46427.1 Uncharacterised protein [Yersinia similis]CNG46172.1 Uncharacterised protein [Yersinia similis]CNH80393.1 Uncharacterised protein [Yersinia similis]
MFELTNLYTSPLTVTDEKTGQRITIAVGHSVVVNGDFTNHLFTQAGMMTADQFDESPNDRSDGNEVTITDIRDEYEALFGKKAPSAAKAETLQKAIETKKAKLAAANKTEPNPPPNNADNVNNPSE